MGKKKATKRAKKYEPKVALKENVTFTDLIGVAMAYQPPKKKATKN
jgi:hypothetical protein